MKTVSFVLGLLVILAAIFLAVLYRDSKIGLTRSFSDKCKYNGKIYKLGDGFASTDGCNTCSCGEGGQVACTLMACDN